MPNVRKEVAVSAAGSSQTTAIYQPRYGERVHRVSLKRLIVADGGTTSTWSVGDGAGTASLLPTVACLGSSGDLVDGSAGGQTVVGGTPSVSAGSALGNGSVVLAAGSTDTSGTISITGGTTTVAGQLAVLTYAGAFPARPFAQVSGSEMSGTNTLITSGSTASQLKILLATAPGNGVTFNIDYQVSRGPLGGKLYGATDTISVTYTPGATPGATAPRCAVMIETEQVWPQ